MTDHRNKEWKLALLGFGNVGRALAELLLRKAEELAQQEGFRWRVVGIATGRHGAALDPQGIDLQQALQRVRAGQGLASLSAVDPPPRALEWIHASGADILLENTPVDYEQGQPALDHIRAALQAGMHAVTANKGPVVHGYRELRDLAARQGRMFLFESTVMDGAPIFSLFQRSLPGANVLAFRGVLNSTTNLILTQMEEGMTFSQAVAHAQQMGIAETDPSGDIDGWDAAIKVAALVTVLMDRPMLPQQVEREGIGGLSEQQVLAARQAGERWKLICQARRQGDGLMARVAPERVPAEDPLFGLRGTSSAITFETDTLGPLTVMESDPGPQTTAYGLLADMLHIHRQCAGE